MNRAILAMTAVLLCLLLIQVSAAQSGVTLVVNDAGDAEDANPGDGVCSTAGEVCTLRAAIQEANIYPGTDSIHFNIPGVGTHVISPATPLPPVLESLTINGYSQPGSTEATATLPANITIQLELPETDAGLYLNVGGMVVRGLRISGARYGIVVENGSGSTIAGNHIVENLEDGIWVVGDHHTIGGALPSDRNVIAGNNGMGVRIDSNVAHNNLVEGNYIGISPDGDLALPNGGDGVYVRISAAIGTVTIRNNVISGNYGNGITTEGNFLPGALITGNVIGLNAAQTQSVPNFGNGILLTTAGVIGNPDAGNVIAGNFGNGIEISSGTGTVVQRNLIGTNGVPDISLGNSGFGIYLHNSSGNLIGGVPDGNVIAYNGDSGIYLTNAAQNRILGNSIFRNAGPGIQLGYNGNNYQPAPVLTQVIVNGGNLLVSGSVQNSFGGGTGLRLEFFAGDDCDPLGDGQVYLGSAEVQADAETGTTFANVSLPYNTNQPAIIATATNTQLTLGTSAFSDCFYIPPSTGLTYIVDVTADVVDSNIGDGLCRANVNGENRCTLRAAIEEANTTPSIDTIHFSIPGAGRHTILPVTALPIIRRPIIVDGLTQSGATKTNPLIEIDGPANQRALYLSAPYSTIRGLRVTGAYECVVVLHGYNTIADNTIGDCTWSAISLSGGLAHNNLIAGNSLGTDPGGSYYGIYIVGAPNNLIGGTTEAARNVINNNIRGVYIVSGGNNRIQGNYIGIDSTGSVPRNNNVGIFINASDTLIGGEEPGAENIISGNTSYGIRIFGGVSNGTRIVRNLIGVNANGDSPAPNGFGTSDSSILIESASNIVIDANVISGNWGNGITVKGGRPSGTHIVNNIIGLSALGNVAVSNDGYGIEMAGVENTIIRDNLISGNRMAGVYVYRSIYGDSDNVQIQGNIVGLDISGSYPVANATTGIALVDTNNSMIGGYTSNEANLVSGNLGSGISVTSSANVAVRGNIVGLNPLTTVRLGNIRDGIIVSTSMSSIVEGNLIGGNQNGLTLSSSQNVEVRNNLIGVNAAGQTGLGNFANGIQISSLMNSVVTENTVSGNAENGVYFEHHPSSTSILGNSIYNNGGRGIELHPDVPSQPAPIVNAYLNPDGDVDVIGVFNSLGLDQPYRVELFNNQTCDSSNAGEGQTLLDSIEVTSNALATGTFVANFMIPTTSIITVTVTNLNLQRTSKFSTCAVVTDRPPADDRAPGLNYYRTRTPVLIWSGVTWAESYEIEIDNDPQFNNSMLLTSTVTNKQTDPLADGTFYWRVRGIYVDGSTGPWSVVETFTVDTTP